MPRLVPAMLTLALLSACSTPSPPSALPPSEVRPARPSPPVPSSAPSSASAPPSTSAALTHVWTQQEIDDRCGFKGDLICCLGPPMPGPPPKPMCHPK